MTVLAAPNGLPFLYHATNTMNLAAILKDGLQAKFYGAMHDAMHISPTDFSVYLSRNPNSNNLNTSLFEKGPVAVLKLDPSNLDLSKLWPDDFVYREFAEGELLASPRSVASALKIPMEEARQIFSRLEQAQEEDIPGLLKPFWRWYLEHKRGGEVAYSADIPPSAILSIKVHPSSMPLTEPLPLLAAKPMPARKAAAARMAM